jgi:osmotically-inducible protein OsmY
MKFASWSMIVAILAISSLQGCAPVVIGAGVGAGVMVGEDRRSSGIMLEDQVIERDISNLIAKTYQDQVNVDVVSYNRVVLLVGEVPTQAIKDDIGSMALETQNVRTVQNELAIAGKSSFVSRSGDALLTSKVKSRLVSNDKVSANDIKVVTSNDTVYLMGLVTRAEADAATQVAATTSGVQRVVKVFEYLD